MAVHVPLSSQSQMEARVLMLSSHNVLHPANGKPISVPSQDMVLGCYYLTRPLVGAKGEGKSFSSVDEVLLAYENKSISMHAVINIRINSVWHKETTVGRVIFNSIIPEELEYIDATVSKNDLARIINQSYLVAGNHKTVDFLDNLKELGFKSATKGGCSISIGDVMIPDQKDSIIQEAQKKVDAITQKYNRHILTLSLIHI